MQHELKLVKWLEGMLTSIAPKVGRIAETVASIASIMASLSWLVAQALVVIRRRVL